METRAIAKYVRISPRKARQAVDLIRGKHVEEAINILTLTPKKSARVVKKVLKSAVANATQRSLGIDEEDLYIKRAFVDGGPSLKRIRPRSMGRAARILKRTSHITVVVSDE